MLPAQKFFKALSEAQFYAFSRGVALTNKQSGIGEPIRAALGNIKKAENKRSAFEIFCVAKKTPKGCDGA